MSATATASKQSHAEVIPAVPSPVASKDLMDQVQRTISVPVAEKAKPYHVGVKPECPKQNLVLGGICFSLYTERVSVANGETNRSRISGSIEHLTDSQVETIKKAASRKVFRMEGASKPLLDTASAHYSPDASDELVARFVYMIPMVNENDMMALVR